MWQFKKKQNKTKKKTKTKKPSYFGPAYLAVFWTAITSPFEFQI